MDSNTTPENKKLRPERRTGCLQYRSKSWHVVVTAEVDGRTTRKWIRLDTQHKAIARRKMARLLANPTGDLYAIAAAPETYAELAKRIGDERAGMGDAGPETSRESLWITPEIGNLAVKDIKPIDIKGIYDHAKAKGMSRSHIEHLRSILRSRFNAAVMEETIESSPVDKVALPKVETDDRERAVLSDEELFVYCSWQHPQKHRQKAVLERQTMSAISRVYGGLRTGDLHKMQWSHFDAPDFTRGIALRSKTRRKQPLEVPEPLRPVLKAWWHETGKHTSGHVFPPLRGEHAAPDEETGATHEKKHVSHAGAMRRDLKRAFGLETWNAETNTFEDTKDRVMTARERELLEETDLTLPVDFHSWRRAFVQALADIGLSAQQAQKLAGHSDLAAHERYLRTSRKTLVIPSAAFPATLAYRSATLELPQTMFSSYATSDSNARPLAPEANALSS